MVDWSLIPPPILACLGEAENCPEVTIQTVPATPPWEQQLHSFKTSPIPLALCPMPAAHLCAGKIVRIRLDAGDDLTEDDTVREHVRLVGNEISVSFSVG